MTVCDQPHFPEGSKVEVSSDEEGFTGVLFEATVIQSSTPLKPASKRKSTSCSGKVLVEYKTLVADESSSEPLRELVDESLLRPMPPNESREWQEMFELNDVVDAFYNDGWWTGIVNGVLEDSRYSVLFQNPPDQIQFGASQLRHHLIWVDSKWVQPKKGVCFVPILCLVLGFYEGFRSRSF